MLTKSSSSGLFFSLPTFFFNLSLFMLRSDQSRIYVHVTDRTTWFKAQSYCREYYTDLVTLRNIDDIYALQSPCLTGESCWIGLQREQSGSPLWKWSNGENSNFTNWIKDQPDNYGGIENCVIMTSFLWNDVPCEVSYEFLCYDEPVLVQESKTWEEALEYCRNLSGSFTTSNYSYDLLLLDYRGFNLTSREVIVNAQTQEVWIGLRFLAGNWLWLNGNPLSGQLPACPAAGNNCGTMTKSGELQLSNCSEKMNFICARK
ncbi:hypothetical protein Q5P01_006124 [Channa striata]|uniref:C-type lectin domain-containing protein n=1 Tax=Channa striata TaxID=64152 RepID=A0AA88NGV2_CHASR|nr:hypothetical protein Q5P01_006124 [Channa striata]